MRDYSINFKEWIRLLFCRCSDCKHVICYRESCFWNNYNKKFNKVITDDPENEPSKGYQLRWLLKGFMILILIVFLILFFIPLLK